MQQASLAARGSGLAAALAAAALVLGCATRGESFDEDMIPFLEDQVTTQEQVREWFGEPLSMRSRASGFSVWRYFEETETRRDTGTLSRIGRSIASIFGARAVTPPVDVEYKNETRHELVLLFDPDGILVEHGYERTRIPSKRVY